MAPLLQKPTDERGFASKVEDVSDIIGQFLPINLALRGVRVGTEAVGLARRLAPWLGRIVENAGAGALFRVAQAISDNPDGFAQMDRRQAAQYLAQQAGLGAAQWGAFAGLIEGGTGIIQAAIKNGTLRPSIQSILSQIHRSGRDGQVDAELRAVGQDPAQAKAAIDRFWSLVSSDKQTELATRYPDLVPARPSAMGPIPPKRFPVSPGGPTAAPEAYPATPEVRRTPPFRTTVPGGFTPMSPWATPVPEVVPPLRPTSVAVPRPAVPGGFTPMPALPGEPFLRVICRPYVERRERVDRAAVGHGVVGGDLRPGADPHPVGLRDLDPAPVVSPPFRTAVPGGFAPRPTVLPPLPETQPPPPPFLPPWPVHAPTAVPGGTAPMPGLRPFETLPTLAPGEPLRPTAVPGGFTRMPRFMGAGGEYPPPLAPPPTEAPPIPRAPTPEVPPVPPSVPEPAAVPVPERVAEAPAMVPVKVPQVPRPTVGEPLAFARGRLAEDPRGLFVTWPVVFTLCLNGSRPERSSAT